MGVDGEHRQAAGGSVERHPGAGDAEPDDDDVCCHVFAWHRDRVVHGSKATSAVVLGHVQRGGTPTAFDRWLATRLGLAAADAVAEGDFGKMMALRGKDVVRIPLIEATGELKVVSPEEYAEAEVFFG